MKRDFVNSCEVASVGYDEGARILEIQLNSGCICKYHDVPFNVYRELMMTEEKGEFYRRQIKDTFKSTIIEKDRVKVGKIISSTT